MVYQTTSLNYLMWFAIAFVLQAIKCDCQSSKSQILNNDHEINHLSNSHGHLWQTYGSCYLMLLKRRSTFHIIQ